MTIEDQANQAAPAGILVADKTEGGIGAKEPLNGSPLHPTNLFVLFTHPSRFFSNHSWLAGRFELIAVTWLAGILAVQDRIDMKLLSSGTADLAHNLGNSWSSYFGFSIFMGIISAVLLWFIAGWWYQVRLELSGAKSVPIKHARAVYQYQNLVQTLPSLVFIVIISMQYPNYLAYWYEDPGLSAMLLLLFPFWSCFTSYRAARTFSVSKSKARVWFFVLPVLFYTVVLLGFGAWGLYLGATQH